MQKNLYKWFSPSLNINVNAQVFGDSGLPIIAFPTSMGKCNENGDFKLIDSVSWFVENGFVKIYCVDGIDEISWYNKKIPPLVRAYNHVCYDKMIHEELVPQAKAETGYNRVATAGCSFGGYHALNYAFRHPENVSHVFTMGAAFNIINRVDGFVDENVYYNNPPYYMPNNNASELWNMKIVLGTAIDDMCRGANEEMSDILSRKGINHWLDIRPYGAHDWPIWREMFPHYLSLR